MLLVDLDRFRLNHLSRLYLVYLMLGMVMPMGMDKVRRAGGEDEVLLGELGEGEEAGDGVGLSCMYRMVSRWWSDLVQKERIAESKCWKVEINQSNYTILY